ncbi:MAG: sensor histidine kinase [Anaerolineales bacterium]
METLNSLLDVSVENPDDRRRARLLNMLLLGVVGISILALFVLLVTDLAGIASNSIVLYVGTGLVLLGSALIFAINRRGNVNLASSILLGLLTVIFTFADSPQNVVQGRTMFMFVIPVLMASFLLRPTSSFVMAAIITAIHITIAVSASVPAYSPIGLAAFFIIALIAWLASSGLENALAELRVINRQLDQRVLERTQELAEANLQLESQARELVDANIQLEKQAHELADANLRLTELDALKSKFVSDVSHELRTPISNLRIYLEMLEEARPEKRERYRAVLQEETRRLENLVRDILDLSRLEMGIISIEMDWQKFNEVVEQVVVANQPRAEAKGLALTYDLGQNLPKIWADASQMNQAVSNLVANAINYTTDGEILVTTKFDPENQRIHLTVEDTGLGIEPEDLPHLFDRFYRGKHAGQSTIPGTGLGLAITKEIVDRHGGTIDVDSTLGKGTIFTLDLPVQAPEHAVVLQTGEA